MVHYFRKSRVTLSELVSFGWAGGVLALPARCKKILPQVAAFGMSYFPQKPKTSVETKQPQPASEENELERLRAENDRLRAKINALKRKVAQALGGLKKVDQELSQA